MQSPGRACCLKRPAFASGKPYIRSILTDLKPACAPASDHPHGVSSTLCSRLTARCTSDEVLSPNADSVHAPIHRAAPLFPPRPCAASHFDRIFRRADRVRKSLAIILHSSSSSSPRSRKSSPVDNPRPSALASTRRPGRPTRQPACGSPGPVYFRY